MNIKQPLVIVVLASVGVNLAQSYILHDVANKSEQAIDAAMQLSDHYRRQLTVGAEACARTLSQHYEQYDICLSMLSKDQRESLTGRK
jgi:hypothetical protein